MKIQSLKVIAGVLGMLLCTAVPAQTERTGSDTARVMQQVQQLTAERAALQADNGKLKKEIDSLQEQLKKLQGEQGSLQRKAQVSEAAAAAAAARATSATTANTEALERSRTQMQELVTRFRETATTLKEIENDRNEARSALSAREQEYKVCVDRNVGLYELNGEILTRMEDRGFWSGVADKEPFTRISRTRLENLIDDYRYRADALRLEKQQAQNQPPATR